MKSFLLFVLCFMVLPGGPCYSQTGERGDQPQNGARRKKVLILGMFHFASRSDRIKLKLDDILGEQRQKEIADLDQSLVKYAPDKIFIEWEPARQRQVDSLFAEYKAGRFALQTNEVYQIGFRLAKSLNLPSVFCMDAPGDYLYDTLVATAKKYGQNGWFSAYGDSITKMIVQEDSAVQPLSIMERLHQLNTHERIMQSHSLNAGVTTAPYLGEPGEYAGAEFMGEWYKRNIRMYSNVVRLTSVQDEKLLIIVGAGHARILRHLFEDHPAFEVVEATDYLK
ncbi:MAG TPA: DUF5694 domain-containing protein [Bacteroidota bacterium]|nr:DUF5694 domain-containing protein [Bacteroidota bacterium]